MTSSVLALASALLALPSPLQPLQGSLLLRGGRVYDAVGEEARPNQGLLVRGGKIVDLAAGDAVEGARVLELPPGATILPGFIDLHAHYAVDLFGRGRVEETVGYPLVHLGNGVTSTYTAGEVEPEKLIALRAAIERGERPGPRIHTAGPYFGRWRKGWKDSEMSLERLTAEVDAWAAQGVSCFKAKGISPEHLQALIERAHYHGLKVTGHLDSGYRKSVNPRDAIGMGIDRIEHFLGGDEFPATRAAYDSYLAQDPASPAFAAIAALYVRHGVYFDATMTAYGYYGARDPEVFTTWEDEALYFTPLVREQLADRPPRPPMELFEKIYWHKRSELAAFAAAGGEHLITTGTDHPSDGSYLAGFGLHREMHAMVLAGLRPAAVLRCATINGARALGVGDRLGTIELGKLADLAIVAGDPLQDIRATRAVRWVVRGGLLYEAPALLAAARGRMGPETEEELLKW